VPGGAARSRAAPSRGLNSAELRVADVVQKKASVVWGVIYLLEDRRHLGAGCYRGYQPDCEESRNAYIRHDSYRLAPKTTRSNHEGDDLHRRKDVRAPRPSEPTAADH